MTQVALYSKTCMMSSAAMNLLTDVESVSCPICLEVFINPKTISCGHKLCEKCLKYYMEFLEPTCPMCRVVFTPSTAEDAREIETLINTSQTICTQCNEKVNLSSFHQHLSSCEAQHPELSTSVEESEKVPRESIKDLPNRHTFSCPYCGLPNLDTIGLLNHVNQSHRHNKGKVVCPICASMPWGDPNQKSSNFVAHINIRHRFEYDTLVDFDMDEDAVLERVLQASVEDK